MHTTLPFLAFLPHGLDFFWIFVLFVVLFGAKKIPDLARGLGRSLGEFKKAKDEFDREVKASIQEHPPAQAIQPPAAPASIPPAPVHEVKKDA